MNTELLTPVQPELLSLPEQLDAFNQKIQNYKMFLYYHNFLIVSHENLLNNIDNIESIAFNDNHYLPKENIKDFLPELTNLTTQIIKTINTAIFEYNTELYKTTDNDIYNTAKQPLIIYFKNTTKVAHFTHSTLVKFLSDNILSKILPKI